jgi:hypothetical protein
MLAGDAPPCGTSAASSRAYRTAPPVAPPTAIAELFTAADPPSVAEMSAPRTAKLDICWLEKADSAAVMSAVVPWGLNSLGPLLSLLQAASARARTAAASDCLA